jgi:5-methylcytosine-specific restriction endonuclease McrA
MDMNTIIAIKGETGGKHTHRVPTLTNRTLFSRDQLRCAYCGQYYNPNDLTRDHIIPSSRGGLDIWTNVVAACSGCNRVKDNKTPEEIDMPLWFNPYTPGRSEVLLLTNHKALPNQVEFLKAKIPEYSRVHN